MKPYLLLIFLFYFSLCAHAGNEEKQFQVYPLTMDTRFERGSSQGIEQRHSKDFSIGLKSSRYTFLIETSSYRVETGTAALGVARTHREFHIWGKGMLNQLNSTEVYWAAGGGVYDEVVSTSLLGASETSQSQMNMMAGAAIGAETMFFRFLIMNLETRILISKDFDPNPQPAVVWRLGVVF